MAANVEIRSFASVIKLNRRERLGFLLYYCSVVSDLQFRDKAREMTSVHFSMTGSRRFFVMYGQNSQKFVSQKSGSKQQPAMNSAHGH
jgi:hypothetical protein